MISIDLSLLQPFSSLFVSVSCTGDTVTVIWDPEFTQPFVNADPSECISSKQLKTYEAFFEGQSFVYQALFFSFSFFCKKKSDHMFPLS